jgi:signal transduction histidine kinase
MPNVRLKEREKCASLSCMTAASIGREAIANCFAHAQARNIEVEIVYDEGSLELRVRDDGRGMDPRTAQSGRAGHWGLLGMRERAVSLGGTLKVWSRPELGTEIELIVPAATAYRAGGTRGKSGWFGRLIGSLRKRQQLDAHDPDDR